jgi:NAD(P)-dependent dehydrogenase (short-subunit alcohol dehydrogenase family)
LRLGSDNYAVGCLDIDELGAAATADSIIRGGGRAASARLDVSCGQEVARVFEAICSELGPPSALVHSAGVLSVVPALELTEAEWRHVIDVDLTGTFLCDQAAARLMRDEARGGRIVNLASVHAQAPGRGLVHYDASKGGIWMLTRNLALELAPHRITVNAVGPGLVINTRLAGDSNEEYLRKVIPSIPLGRAGEPEDVAGSIAFLCSSDASYITGIMLFVDGGMLLSTQM